MNNDKELLELAAKAAGIKLERSRLEDPLWRDFLLAHRDPEHPGHGKGWNPLTDDGDALRLANKLRIDLDFDHENPIVEAYRKELETSSFCACEAWSPNDAAATRRCIVTAAAEIGRNL